MSIIMRIPSKDTKQKQELQATRVAIREQISRWGRLYDNFELDSFDRFAKISGYIRTWDFPKYEASDEAKEAEAQRLQNKLEGYLEEHEEILEEVIVYHDTKNYFNFTVLIAEA